jgi:hypothetical protein
MRTSISTYFLDIVVDCEVGSDVLKIGWPFGTPHYAKADRYLGTVISIYQLSSLKIPGLHS